jgi:hypothetical protein
MRSTNFLILQRRWTRTLSLMMVGVLSMALVGCDFEVKRPKDRKFEPNKKSKTSSSSKPSKRNTQTVHVDPATRSQMIIEQSLKAIESPRAKDKGRTQAVSKIAAQKELGLPHIRKLVTHSHPTVRVQAILALGRIGERSDADTLARLLRTGELLDVRRWSANGLEKMRAHWHLDALIDGMEDPKWPVRLMCHKGIMEMAGLSYPFDARGSPSLRQKQMGQYRKNAAFLKDLSKRRTALLEAVERKKEARRAKTEGRAP